MTEAMRKANVTKRLLLATRYVLEQREGYYEGRGNMMVKQMNRDDLNVMRPMHRNSQAQPCDNFIIMGHEGGSTEERSC